MATDKLLFHLEADTKGFVKGMDKVNKSTASLNQNVKKNSRAFTQVAYALDDAQYGFRGVQNNIQYLAVTMGLGGPLILGITALTIALNSAIENWHKFGDEAQGAIAKALAGNQGGIAKGQIFAEVLRLTKVGTDENTYALQQLKSLGFDPVNESLAEFLRLQSAKIRLNAVEQAGSQLIAKELGNIIEKQSLLQRVAVGDKTAIVEVLFRGLGNFHAGLNSINKSIGKSRDKVTEVTEQIANNVTSILGEDGVAGFLLKGKSKGKDVLADYKSDLTHVLNILTAQGVSKKEIAEAELSWLENMDKTKLSAKQLEDILKRTQVLTTGLANGFYDVKEKAVDAGNEIGEAMGAALKTGISNAITGLAKTIGETLAGEGDFGEKFLGILGSFMTAFGSAIIAIGVAALNLELALSSGQAWLAIGAGAALVVAGSVLSSLSSKGVDGKGSNASHSAATSSTTTPTSIQGFGQSGSLVATVRGQELRFLLQGANDSYQAIN